METTIRSAISSPSASVKQPSACLYMDVCVLGCTPGHIPRYMSQTSNNNIRLLSCLLWILVMNARYDPRYDTCYDSRYALLYWTPAMMPVMFLL